MAPWYHKSQLNDFSGGYFQSFQSVSLDLSHESYKSLVVQTLLFELDQAKTNAFPTTAQMGKYLGNCKEFRQLGRSVN